MGKWFCILLFMCHLKTFYAKCGGKSEINDVLNGTIVIGNPYPENTHCQWLIRVPSPGQQIKLIFQTFATECSFDYLKVYDGASISAKLLAAFSGDTLPPVLLSSSSSVLLDFFSDNNYSLKGWNVYFEIHNCSGGCSGRGSCAGNRCICDELYTGDACDVKLCPQMCNNITAHGECSKLHGECTCNTGYVGQSCSLFLHGDADAGTWHVINQNSDIFHARFGHAGVYIKESSAFWIFGGSDLNNLFGDLVKFDFTQNKWFLINSTGSSPTARFRHTMVTYKNTLILFGGELDNGTLMNDIWSFNMSRSEWKLLPNSGSGIPPGLASHTANVLGDKLFIFGGRSDKEALSSEMYTYDLSLMKGWEKVIYRLGKKSDLRLVGHSSVYYSTLRSLVVFGGFQQHRYSYFSEKINTIHMYNVEHKVWIKVRGISSHASYLPQPRAYHSAVVAGDYMVVYGGNVHKHTKDETCYENKLHLFNLKSFTWVSPSLMAGIGSSTNLSWQPKRGRFSHVASVLNGSTILVSGGFSGIPHADLLAFKLPTNIAAGSVNNNSHCSFYDEHSCDFDPSCVWCKDNPSCLSMNQWNTCSVPTSSATPHICSVFDQCVSCLVWGSRPDLACGWCVQDSRCYPRGLPSGLCSSNTTGNTYGARGWWGESSIFLTLLDQCRTEDKPPGLMVKVRIAKKDTARPDISIMNPLSKTFDIQSSEFDTVHVKMSGFIYPFLTSSVNRNVDIVLRASKQSVSLRLSTDEDPSNSKKIISFKNDDYTLKIARMINNSVRLFPNASVNKMYYMEINSEFKPSDQNVHLDVSMDRVLLNGTYVRPFFSSDCSVYTSCLQCLFDASCGWYSNNNTCVRRDNSAFSYSGETVYLIINATFCDTCAQYIDCTSCLNTTNCGWNVKQFCDHLGQYEAQYSSTCSKPCNSNSDCGSCVENSRCFWCENKQKCIPRFSYVPDHLHSQCSHWTNVNTKVGKCRNCSKRNVCEDCNKESYCGWCGQYHNGKCFDGGFDGPSHGQCERQLMASNVSNSSLWSYTRCPDEDECITKKDCATNATCTNLDPGYKCECIIGFEGNGHYCNISCNPPCVHGKCNQLLTCDCDLGWTGNVCSLDCGCNYHSSCHTGIGVCDKCQEFTYGDHCEVCQPGSHGNATTSFGCNECECNGHGNDRRGICDIKTGDCFCLNHTMGKHCNQCLPGLLGHPEQGGGCYHPCESHSVLSNVTDGALSTSIGPGTDIKENTNCVWIITTSRNESKYILYTNEAITGSITLRIKDVKVDCQTDHVYVYEGFPPYKLEDLHTSLHSSFNLIGTVCGFDASNVPTIESHTGTLVVIFKGNLGSHSSTKGFNATFVINQCPNACTGNRHCFNNGTHHECVCKAGYAGTGCDDVICPSNCSEKLGQGYCDQALKSCVCTKGFVGKSCEIHNPFNNFNWKLMSNIDERSSTLPRMGHTMVADEITQSLIIYGGYSFGYGVLGDTWIYNITNRNYVSVQHGSKAPSPRYLHAGAVYNRQMYISGGKMDKDFSSELWKFGLDSKQWTKAQILPSRVAGHTLSVVNDTMYLIGGYDPDSHCSTEVYVLDLKLNSTWTKLSTFGDNFNPCFGHTTVYDKKTKSLIVFGKDAEQIISGSDSATLAVLHLPTKEWSVKPVPVQSRYFHSALVMGDVMIVTGGYTSRRGVQKFAEISLVFNIRCREWEKLDEKGVFSPTLAHSSIAATNNEVYLFGGYNGLASDKLFRLNISSDWCSMFSTRDRCVGIGGCYWCFVNAGNQSFCFSSNINSPHNCSSDVALYNQCSLNPVAAALINAFPSSDICVQQSLSENCSSCIGAKDNNGKPGSCFWAVDSRRCLSAHFTSILCVFGICGRLLREYDTCPGLCNSTRYCHDCLEQYYCGWCTDPRGNGNGICMEGTIEGSLNGTCQKKNVNLGLPVTTPIWVSSVCLLEDECLNKHHQCNENETCFNLENGYECRCKSGYNRQLSKCVPVCVQGCVNGTCIAPNVCRCYFGMVGSNCSTLCACFGKGNCVDENQLDNCTDCQDNTTGRSCARCLPGFIGQDGLCNSCSEKCYKNADECYSKTGSANRETSSYGPRDDGTHYCMCKDNSAGIHCESCENGFFKLNPDLKCERCLCRGHASTCTAHSGLGCDCQNNTIAPQYCSISRPLTGSNCYRHQCSKCDIDSSYIGDPSVEGQQCYRTMNVLGHLSLTREKSRNLGLLPGQTSFFSIHPSYTNADVRLTLDVFDGSIDVYIATGNNAFRVSSNQTVSIFSSSISRLDVYSDGLNKYVTFSGDSIVAVVKEVTHRFVVTFPFEEHKLDGKQFYIVVKAGSSGAEGITYFKQDNVKIYIVVFFAVFFSCFFLVLSVVVIGWSIKQHIYSRREVHNREILTERMQSRPFAKFAFLFEYQSPSPSILRHRKTTGSTRKAIRAMGVGATNDYLASVTTVMIQMPQTEKIKMSLMLGTTLTTMNPNHLDRLTSKSRKAIQQTTNL